MYGELRSLVYPFHLSWTWGKGLYERLETLAILLKKCETLKEKIVRYYMKEFFMVNSYLIILIICIMFIFS